VGKVVVSENTSIDGVLQDPTGEEGFRRGGWFGQVTDNDRREWAKAALAEALCAQALLLGRRTYEFFAARWPSRTDALAERLNGMPRYVVSSSLHDPDWANCSVLSGDVMSKVADLKRDLDGDLVVYASFQLVRTLIEHGLVDELRLTLYPCVLGIGERLFEETGEKIPMRLINAGTLGDNLAVLEYEFGESEDLVSVELDSDRLPFGRNSQPAFRQEIGRLDRWPGLRTTSSATSPKSRMLMSKHWTSAQKSPVQRQPIDH
jgi:dihydrofolate reductase